jgi:transcriptional regulator with XRE-family HTH domain
MGIRKTLAANLVARMETRWPDAPDRVRALADASGVARSTIQRLLEIDVAGANIDTLNQLANGLHCEVYQLLMPDHHSSRHRRSSDGQKRRPEPPPDQPQE